MFTNRTFPLSGEEKKRRDLPPYDSDPESDSNSVSSRRRHPQKAPAHISLRKCSKASTSSSKDSEWPAPSTDAQGTAFTPVALTFSNTLSPPTQRTPVKSYSFYYNRCMSTLRIFAGDSTDQSHLKASALYRPQFYEFRSRPDVVLHSGPSKKGPVVAIAEFRWSRALTLGFGDPENPTTEREMVYEKMENTSRFYGHQRYQVQMEVEDHDRVVVKGSGPKRRRTFEWRRTRSKTYGATGSGRITLNNYKVIDVETGEVLAVYLANVLKSWRKKGKLVLFKGEAEMGRNWEIMLLLGSCGLIEKALRRTRNYSMGQGYGGG